ncbi:MAG: antibiotic biosynthesis monooxygenase [Sphingobacteriales bacterium]|nr:antibiotic biosynthesis monooxygenase [Sphingobacteriales bacterium]
MIAVLFEASPAKGKWEEYLELAAGLRPELSKIEGFISMERFQSIADPEKVLSLSFWKDEESLIQWRNIELHRKAQQEGRNSIFEHYRLRVATVQRDYGMTEREQAPDDSNQFHK